MSDRVVLSRDLLTTAATVQPVDVPLPELGAGVVVPIRPMTAKEWTTFQADQIGKNGKPNANAKIVRERMVIKCCINDDGSPIFTQADIETLGSCRAGVIERIVDSILKHSGLATTDVEAIAKNSEET